jgi:hypothetical protein
MQFSPFSRHFFHLRSKYSPPRVHLDFLKCSPCSPEG